MILGPPSPCFIEINEAIAQLQAARGDDRPVVFHWQYNVDSIPKGAIVYNFDLPGIHFGIGDMARAAKRASEVWDFSRRNVAEWRAIGVEAKHAPVGYHPSMRRFERVMRPVHAVPTLGWYDVVFVGCVNERRQSVFDALQAAGVSVVVAPADRSMRDELLSRCRTSINMLYYADGVYPHLRGLHLAANDVPFVSEDADEAPEGCDVFAYADLVEAVRTNVLTQRHGARWTEMRLPE